MLKKNLISEVLFFIITIAEGQNVNIVTILAPDFMSTCFSDILTFLHCLNFSNKKEIILTFFLTGSPLKVDRR